MPDETNGVNNAARCYRIEAVQLSASLVMSLFASFWQNLWNSNEFGIFIVIVHIFIVWVTLIKITNTILDRSAALVLSVINWTYSSCTGFRQIRLEIWPEPDLGRFPKNGQILDLPEPELKSGASLQITEDEAETIDKPLHRSCYTWQCHVSESAQLSLSICLQNVTQLNM